MTNLILFGSFALFLLIKVPIGVSVGMAIVTYMVTVGSQPLTYLATNMFTSCDSFPLMAIPFFVLAGALMEGGGLSRRLANLGGAVVGHITGGFAIVTVITCMFFGAISGSGPATVAAIGAVMVPAMIERGYDKPFAVALIAASGCLGVIVPPSIPMVLYGVSTGASVGSLFMGGFGPALVLGGGLCVLSFVVSKRRGYKGSGEAFSMRKVFTEFKSAVFALLVPVIILGGIYGGYFTPTEAAVIACVYGLIAGALIYRELNLKKLIACLVGSAETVGTVLIMVGTGSVLGKVLALERIPDAIMSGLTSLSDNRIVILLLINLLLMVVGCIMDTTAAILILSPILYPVAKVYDVGIIHFGLIMVCNMAIAFITPPVGVNLFVASGMTKMKFTDLCRAIVPFIIVMFISLQFITYVPAITEWLPRALGMIP
ncbi:C4-dicarboxylate TRAP transporter large permease protein DctM [bioreactor metagenome]|uniref:C4-dicarboxylate TRAP transporter large permease protein DctM n=1 Tax=bioreactor metagenome TaxID=1076179 RepID=A0A644ZJ39_9ZZZZ